VYSLDRHGDYSHQLATQRYQVPFWVKSAGGFERDYPRGSGARLRAEMVRRACWS
jgi:hypothetical protein